MFDDHHGELAGMLLDQIAFLDQRIAALAARAATLTEAMPAAWGIDAGGTTSPDAGTGPDAAALPAVTRLAEVPGISPDLARAIIAEIGPDMSRFPAAAHLVSWAGLCPSARQSGPRYPDREDGPGQHVAARYPRPGRQRRRPHPHLPRRAVPPDPPPPRQGQGDAAPIRRRRSAEPPMTSHGGRIEQRRSP